MSDSYNETIRSVEGSAGISIADRYEIRDILGKGAQGTVLEAFDIRLRRLVAIKMVKISPAASEEDKETLRRFEIEARAAARLSHPGIVPVYDSGIGSDFAWIAMEIVIGQSIADELASGSLPELPETARIVAELLDALDYAHNRGIVHCDVKPANILLAMDLDEGLGKVRLTDFGIAQIERSDQAAREAGSSGTPRTMAPEQVNGEAVDHRADIWAAGVILYEMLTGARPFTGGIPAIFTSILLTHPLPPSQKRPGVPVAFDAVIERALMKDPQGRYASAAEMAAAVRAAVDADVIPAVAAPQAAGEDDARGPTHGRFWREAWIAAIAFAAGAALSTALHAVL
jgi:eukaryotic-like serine/threonine-protein kinase